MLAVRRGEAPSAEDMTRPERAVKAGRTEVPVKRVRAAGKPIKESIMKRMLFAGLFLLLGIAGIARADSVLAHGDDRFDGYITFCATESGFRGSETLPDGTLIQRFFNIGNLWVTGNPRIDGVERNEVTATFPPGTAPFTLDIRGTVDVHGLDGGWRFRQIVTVGADFERGFGFGLGTGDLWGQLIIYRVGAVEVGIETPCDVPAGAPISGRILRFGWRT